MDAHTILIKCYLKFLPTGCDILDIKIDRSQFLCLKKKPNIIIMYVWQNIP